jgi:hypothetical protein
VGLLTLAPVVDGSSPIAGDVVIAIIGAATGIAGTVRLLKHRVDKHMTFIEQGAARHDDLVKEITKWRQELKNWQSETEKGQLELRHALELSEARRPASESMTDGPTRPHRTARK